MKLVDSKAIKVGIADLNFVKAPDVIRTSGLGSCVGVVIFDPTIKIAGMAHVMLPDSNSSKKEDFNPYKYADTAIPILVETLLKDGARKFALKAKIAGGAQMFAFSVKNDMLRIGERNVTAVKQMLEDYRIPIIAEDVHGNSGRTIEFSPETSMLHIRTISQGSKEI
ncbi:MAG TPA: chemotaxis protein CheD [Bacilli bacterium]|nr:chemotaxis protein CheD [Bacilli bacterium]